VVKRCSSRYVDVFLKTSKRRERLRN
jgi:hypothetical protein